MNRFMKASLYRLSFIIVLCLPQLSAAEGTNLFTGKDAASVVASALTKNGAPDNIKVNITGMRDEDTLVASSGVISVDTNGFELDKKNNHWQVTLLFKEDGHNLAPVKLAGRYDELLPVPVLKHTIAANEIIAEDDIAWDKQSAQHLRKNIVTNASDLIGKSPRHTLSQGRAIRMDEIAGPALVNKGSQVTLLYKGHNLEIETFGQALDTGAKGDVIRVRNTTSKAVIQGTVISANHIRVSSPQSDSAEAF